MVQPLTTTDNISRLSTRSPSIRASACTSAMSFPTYTPTVTYVKPVDNMSPKQQYLYKTDNFKIAKDAMTKGMADVPRHKALNSCADVSCETTN